MISDPNFHKNQSYLYSIYALYIFLFHLYYIQDGERSNTIEIFHVFLLSSEFFHLHKVLKQSQQIQNDYERLINLQYRVIKLQQSSHLQLYLVKLL